MVQSPLAFDFSKTRTICDAFDGAWAFLQGDRREFAGNFPSSAGKAAGNVMRFWRSDDQRIQWLAAKCGDYLVDANARFAAGSKWRSVMSISTLVNAIDNLAKEKSPNMFPRHVRKIISGVQEIGRRLGELENRVKALEAKK